MSSNQASADVSSYFGYGTLLGTPAMRDYCPTATPTAVARYPEHRLVFRQYSDDPSRCGCHIAPAHGEDLYGVVYHLTHADMTYLDEVSGVPQGWFERVPITVTTLTGEPLRTTTYLLAAPGAAQVPDDSYSGFIRIGARTAGLPDAYVEHLLNYLDGLAA